MSSPTTVLQTSERPIHHSADVEPGATIGSGTRVWAHSQIRAGAVVGLDCVIGRNVFVDRDVVVGDRCKVQNNASLHEGVVLHDGVFVGPAVVFTNDRLPRAITAADRLKTTADWELGRTVVRHGAAIGAGALIVTGVTIGRWAMVGAGSVVTCDVPDHGLVLGNPARLIGYISADGVRCSTEDAARVLTDLEGVAAAGR
jgi:acetyltransferase-like isoleucine patch superfamily enzyme